MNKKELAKKIDGALYRDELNTVEDDYNGLVVVFGASDDLMEFRGEIDDEFGCYDGGTVYLNKNGLASEPSDGLSKIEAIWCPSDDDGNITSSWIYETDIPHEKFRIFEDGELYCVGIVFDFDDLPS